MSVSALARDRTTAPTGKPFIFQDRIIFPSQKLAFIIRLHTFASDDTSLRKRRTPSPPSFAPRKRHGHPSEHPLSSPFRGNSVPTPTMPFPLFPSLPSYSCCTPTSTSRPPRTDPFRLPDAATGRKSPTIFPLRPGSVRATVHLYIRQAHPASGGIPLRVRLPPPSPAIRPATKHEPVHSTTTTREN